MLFQKRKFLLLKNDPNQNYNILTDKFLGIVNEHAPLKRNFVKGNKAPFINTEFQKEMRSEKQIM